MKLLILTSSICLLLFTTSCNNNSENQTPSNKPSAEQALPAEVKTEKAPIVNVEDTLEIRRNVLCVRDSAANYERLLVKLDNIFNKKIADVLKASKLTAKGLPMAWYNNKKGLYFFEAGVPVDSLPNKAAKGMYIKRTNTDSCIVAHFFGPINLTTKGYDVLNERLTDLKKSKSNSPYEIYVNGFQLGSVGLDPYKLETTIVMPYK
jgi:hypothetical protein